MRFLKDKGEIIQNLKQTQVINSLSLKRENLSALIELCNMIVLSYDTQELLSVIIHMSSDILKAERSAIILLDEDKKNLQFCFVSGKESDL